MSARVWACALPLALALGACSAIVRELPVSCDSDDDCAALNEAEHLTQSCITYQCRSDKKGCEKQPRDKDRDGVPDERACADAGLRMAKLDCDDDDETRAPDHKERCDGVDNDCDQIIDEEALTPDSLRPPDSIGLGGVRSLAFADGAGEPLLVLATREELSLRRSTLVRWERSTLETLQDPEQRNCQAELATCALDPIAIAATPSLLVAIGVEATGSRLGTLRVGLRQDWSNDWTSPLLWDASDATPSTSSLRDGVDPPGNCSKTGSARLPRIALRSRSERGVEGLALWRQGDGPSALFGIGLDLDAAGRRVEALSGPCSARLSDVDQPGHDAASVQTWPVGALAGYFVAYDSVRGVELTRVSQLARGAETAFSLAETLWLDEPGARHVALALDWGEPVLGLAWQVPVAGGARVHFAEQTLKGEDAQFGPRPKPFAASGNVEMVEGPFVVYLPQGVVRNTEEGDGWLVLWVEAAAAAQRLMAVRIAKGASKPLEEPFVLFEGARLQHAFAYSRPDQRAGYGFVNGNGGQLNIGSLECRVDP